MFSLRLLDGKEENPQNSEISKFCSANETLVHR